MRAMENRTHTITCIGCGKEFARKRGYVGNHCEVCRDE